MALIAQADLEARLQRSLTAEESSSFTTINSALQTYVESIIGSSVEAADETTRYFDGGCQHLRIDPCTDISSVKLIDDDYDEVYTYETRDYTTDPKNWTVKTMLRHRSGAFMTGINNIAVSAKFSIYADPKIQGLVKDALLNALSGEIQNTRSISKESIEGYSVEYATPESKTALDKLKYLFPEV